MLRWLKALLAEERNKIRNGDAVRVEQRHIPGSIFAGLVIGCLLSYLFVIPAIIVFVACGFALGYAYRSYLSHQRRQRFRRERESR
jgi:Flp pilus assembly protein TadB